MRHFSKQGNYYSIYEYTAGHVVTRSHLSWY